MNDIAPSDVASLTEAAAPKPMKLCKVCAQEMPAAALKCTKCDTWQNWRGTLSFSIPVLSLVLALVTVVLSSGRQFYQAITHRPSVDAVIEDSKAGPALVRLRVINSEPKHVVFGNEIACDLVNRSRNTRGKASFLREGEDGAIGAGELAIPAHSDRVLIYQSLEWVPSVMKLADLVETIEYTCDVTFTFDGEEHKIRKRALRLVPAT